MKTKYAENLNSSLAQVYSAPMCASRPASKKFSQSVTGISVDAAKSPAAPNITTGIGYYSDTLRFTNRYSL